MRTSEMIVFVTNEISFKRAGDLKTIVGRSSRVAISDIYPACDGCLIIRRGMDLEDKKNFEKH